MAPNNVTWTTLDNLGSLDGDKLTDSFEALARIEASLQLKGLYEDYVGAVMQAGGNAISQAERLKIAGYVFFADPEKGSLVKKPMSLLRDNEKVDKIRSIGVRIWGDVKTRPMRSLVTYQSNRNWHGELGTVPPESLDTPSDFTDLCLDDRIKWVHTCMSEYHSSLARGGQEDAAVLHGMEKACSVFNVPPFVDKRRDPEYVRYVVEEYKGQMTMDDVNGSVTNLEESPKPDDIEHDVEMHSISGPDAMLRKILPTVKAMDLYDTYKELVVQVRKVRYNGGKTKPMDRLEIAKYLIMKDMGTITYFPTCLMDHQAM